MKRTLCGGKNEHCINWSTAFPQRNMVAAAVSCFFSQEQGSWLMGRWTELKKTKLREWVQCLWRDFKTCQSQILSVRFDWPRAICKERLVNVSVSSFDRLVDIIQKDLQVQLHQKKEVLKMTDSSGWINHQIPAKSFPDLVEMQDKSASLTWYVKRKIANFSQSTYVLCIYISVSVPWVKRCDIQTQC